MLSRLDYGGSLMVGFMTGTDDKLFIPSTYGGNKAAYNISWQLPNDIANTHHEIARLSPTYAERHTKTAMLMWEIQNAVKG